MKHHIYTRDEVLSNLKGCKAYEAEDGDIFITKMLDGIETVILHFGTFGHTEEDDEYICYAEETSFSKYSLEGQPMEDVGFAYANDWMSIKPIPIKSKKNFAITVAITISAIFVIWFALSYLEVVIHNDDFLNGIHYIYNKFNLFSMIIGG